MRLPRMALMRRMEPEDAILVYDGPANKADVLAQSIGSKIGGRWRTHRVQLIEGDKVVKAVVLTCLEQPNPAGKRGRPRKADATKADSTSPEVAANIAG